MSNRCLNRVTLIGNLTRDPELRYTPAGMAVVSFGLATNRSWVTKQGEKKEDAQFHRIVAWNKLAELCSQLLVKGRRVYVEGKIQYRDFTDRDNNKKQVTEIIIDDMIILDGKGASGVNHQEEDLATPETSEAPIEDIVIPDDLGAIEPAETNESATADTTTTAKPAEENSKPANDEEMPF